MIQYDIILNYNHNQQFMKYDKINTIDIIIKPICWLDYPTVFYILLIIKKIANK